MKRIQRAFDCYLMFWTNERIGVLIYLASWLAKRRQRTPVSLVLLAKMLVCSPCPGRSQLRTDYLLGYGRLERLDWVRVVHSFCCARIHRTTRSVPSRLFCARNKLQNDMSGTDPDTLLLLPTICGMTFRVDVEEEEGRFFA